MRLRNLTPHEVTVDGHDPIPPDGVRAVVLFGQVPEQVINGVVFRGSAPVVGVEVPEAEEGTLLIVSSLVRAALPSRRDLITPDSGQDATRSQGQVVSCRRFITNW
jgi:hypothetical protein